MNATWRIIALDPEKRIGGVWRLTDDKKFYVGDPTPDGRIEGFQVHQGSMLVRCGRVNLHGISEVSRITLLFLHELS
jgi:hypothetical protein